MCRWSTRCRCRWPSLVLYVLIGFLKPEDTPERLAIIERVNTDGDGGAGAGAAAAVPQAGRRDGGRGRDAELELTAEV
ncbi:hypothetical protein SFUMM280S_02617 [Streptomyces fumanus]